MSASSSSDDPVQTVIDLLDGTAAGNWPGGTKPTHIEDRWTSSLNEKRRRTDPACYAYSPDVGTEEQFGRDADTKVQTEIVDVEVWTRVAADSVSIASDVVSILEDYWNDGKANTNWNRIRPQQTNDQRGEDSLQTVMGRADNQYILTPRVRLEREATLGT